MFYLQTAPVADQMKNALSLVCMLLAGILMPTTSFAQSNTLFNPDYNGDGFIGVDDILGALSFYDNAWDGPVAIVIYGCTYPLFAEYDASANVDDGSCATLEVLGCTDSSYLEYDASANVDDGSCLTNTSCGNDVTYQGYDYATVLIGEQCWFAENLRAENYRDGAAIPNDLSGSEWINTSSGAVAVMEITYGRLYNWFAVDDYRGLCPSGWHVPTDGEWMTMEMALGMSEAVANGTGARGTDQGTQMKTSYGWHENGYYEFLADNIIWFPYSTGTNSSGFSGLPGGFRRSDGLFFEDIYSEDYDYCDDAGYFGTWWSSSGDAYLTAWSRSLHSYFPGVSREPVDIRGGYSVRCVRDAE